ncbi:MAG TPA: DUF3299 domain-containing protein [Accumulibacter sp.]|nr:DUF3299 domain-containing protein [Accumulibacter sp.]
MRMSILMLLAACLVGSGSSSAAGTGAEYRLGDRLSQPKSAAPPAAGYEEIGWDALIPQDWDPRQAFKGLDLATLTDADPRAMEALRRLKDTWDNAPVESSLRGRRIRIAGFLVPLERKGEEVSEFLLVPYFGACIHTPPPPANQIIHVVSAKPLKGAQSMDPVWVSGTLEIGRAESAFGTSGYRMRAELVAPYTRR